MKNHGDKWAADLGVVCHRNHVPGSTRVQTSIDVFPVFRILEISNSHSYRQDYDLVNDDEETNERSYMMNLERIIGEVISEK